MTMDFGFSIPGRGPLATREGIKAFATRGEELGFSCLGVPDHIVVPRNIDSRYPYSSTGTFPGAASGDCVEQLAIMAYLAGITSEVKLLSSVMVVPHRSAVFAAKALASIDLLSNGRVIAGIGSGWMAEEFKAIGAPPFSDRGRVTDEYLEAFKVLWAHEQPVYQGNYVSFEDVTFLPRPVQQPHIPIWVGGESKAALRRTVTHGDAWYPVGSNPQFPLNTKARYSEALERLYRVADEHNRDPATIELAYWAHWPNDGEPIVLSDGQHHLFTGSPDQIVDDIGVFRELGVQHLFFNFQREDMASSVRSMEEFVDRILSRVG